jgi:nucleoside diphosphate kinase
MWLFKHVLPLFAASFFLHLALLQAHDIEMERTYIMVKPDGVQRGLVGEIIKRFEQRGFQLLALKMVQPTQAHLEEHYKDLKGKGFFPGLIKYMASGPVVAMVSFKGCLVVIIRFLRFGLASLL